MQPFLTTVLSGQTPLHPCGETTGLQWQWRDEGILHLEPKHRVQQALVLSCGIHGNETAPVEIVAQLVDKLLQGALALEVRLLVITGNPAALRAGKRYKEYDINRMFSGRWQRFQDCAEARRAWQLEQAVERFFMAGEAGESRWHLDLHTAIRGSWHPRFGVLPFTTRPWPEDFMHWLAAAGMEALVFHRAPAGTFAHFSSDKLAAASCTLELGKALPFGENDLSQFQATEQALVALLTQGTLPEVTQAPLRYRVAQQLTRESERFVLHMSADTLNFTAFPQGTLLAEEGDKQYFVRQAREYVLFPNPNVAPGLRAGLMLVEDNSHNSSLGML
ncbi:succinylglutamate desuccinylase [Enterobacterales bacterium CwR94]|nr:succinylglutamate desuccinylase [Enterobacterales bacterium CwR94]